jgi:hypothetical protein
MGEPPDKCKEGRKEGRKEGQCREGGGCGPRSRRFDVPC